MRRRVVVIAVAVLLASAGAAALVGWRDQHGVEYRHPVQTAESALPHATVTEATATLWANERRVMRAGRDGVIRRYRYFEERWVEGRLDWRRPAMPAGQPTSTVVSRPTTEVVLVGLRKGARVNVNAADRDGMRIGVIGPSGIMRIEVRGTVTIAGPGTEAGPNGNASHRFYHKPYRPDVFPGAVLFRVADSPWFSLRDLGVDRQTFLIRGEPNKPVECVVNDAPKWFQDNRGSFEVIVWPDGTSP